MRNTARGPRDGEIKRFANGIKDGGHSNYKWKIYLEQQKRREQTNSIKAGQISSL